MSNTFKIARAYFVHLFTASGLLFALLAMWSISKGAQDVTNIQWYFIYLTITVFVDAVDGTMARKFEVKKYAPKIDGSLLDNIIDYITFVFLPAYFLLASGVLAEPYSLLAAALIVMASSYQFCQVDAKVDNGEHFFTGFPSYWNMLILYLFWWQLSSVTNFAIIVFLVIMVFVPIKYIYPSRTKKWKVFTNSLLFVYSVTIFYEILFNFATPHAWFMWLSYFVFAYYILLSFYLNLRPQTK